MERRSRSPILAVLLVLTLAAALLPVLSRSAQAAEVPAGAMAVSVEKMWYTKDGTITHDYKYYYSIDDAWEAARSGTPVRMTADWQLASNQPLYVSENMSVTFYMDGHTIDRGDWENRVDYDNYGGIFCVTGEGAHLTVYGADGSGKLGTLQDGYGENDPFVGGAYDRGGAIKLNEGTALTMQGVRIYHCEIGFDGGAIWAGKGAHMTLTNMVFEDCTAGNNASVLYADRAGVYMENCEVKMCSNTDSINGMIVANGSTSAYGGVTLKNVTIDGVPTSNQGENGGTCVYVTNSDLTMTGCTILNGQNSKDSNHYGGGLYAKGSNVSLQKVNFKNCNSEWGGGMYLQESTVALKNVTIDGCYTTGEGYGGGIYAYDHVKMTTENVTISNCRAKNYGGGIYAEKDSDGMTLDGVKIESCQSDQGGGIYAWKCKMTLNNCDIAYSQANEGGGIYLGGDAGNPLTLNGTEIHSCQATSSGGGIYSKEPNLTLTGSSEVRSNSAQSGGGLYFGGSICIIKDAKLDSNYASQWGGGIYYKSGNVTLNDNALVRSNVAGMGGGGLCGESGKLIVSTNGIQGNNGAMAGGGIYIGGGTVVVDHNKTLSDNQSQDGNGGGIFVNSGTLQLWNGATLKGNRAKQNGGGIYFAGSPDYRLEYTTLTGNTAGGSGGAIFYDGGEGNLTLKNVKITGNHAKEEGGGACIDKSSAVTLNYATIKDNTCGADKNSKNKASNLYLRSGAVITALNGTSEAYVGSDDARSGGFYVASLSGSNQPDLTGLHASDPAFLPAATGVGRNLWGVVLVKAYSHVTVKNGTIDGGNEYRSRGDSVSITANSAPAGKTFDKWVADRGDVTFTNANSPSTTFTMPNRDVTVTATYKALPSHTVKVEGEGTTGGGSYYEGATVIITAPAQKTEGEQQYSFTNWTGDNVTFTDSKATTTTFVMPDHDVIVTAEYQRNVTYIHEVKLTVADPVAGSPLGEPKLDDSVSASVSSLSYQWQGTEGTPVGGTATCNSQYLLMVRLTAAENYQFPENVSVTFGGQPALSSTLNNGTLTAYYAFDKTGADTVTKVEWPADVTIKQGETPSLPDRVSITTTFGTANAAEVTWDPEPEALTAAGTYEYTPTLVLPDGVIKPDSVTIKPVKVTVKAPDPVGKITITPVTNSDGTVTVTLSCATPDAIIRYSIDGENWDTVNTSYTGSFILGSKLVKNGGKDVYVLRVTAEKTGMAMRKDLKTIEVTVPKPSYNVTITDGSLPGFTANEDGTYTVEKGSLVAVKAEEQTNKVFKGWTATSSVKLRDANAPTTTFTMPGNNVTITANFVTMQTEAALTMTEPTTGENLTLPETATWNGNTFPVSWTTEERGENVLCTATITIPADLSSTSKRYFANTATATINGSADEVTVSDGSLTVTKTYTLEKPHDPLYSVTILSTTDGEERKLGDYPAGSEVTITAPEFEKYSFAMWMGVLGSKSNEELSIKELTGTNNGTVTFTMPEENIGILALYNSLVKEISFTIPAPKVGEPLAQYPTAMHMELADGTKLDVTDQQTLQQFEISWDTTDEKAVFGKQYTAIVFATEDVNMTPMADGMTVKVNNGKASASYSGKAGASGAYYVRTNDAVQVFNVFPATSATMTGLTKPEDIHDIKPGTAYNDIALPDYVEVQTSCGAMAVPVEWKSGDETVKDKTTPTGQDSVTLTGTLDYPDALVHTGFGNTVTLCVWLDKEIVVPEKVATPTAVPTGTGTGEYENEVEVTLYCATPGAKIYYTTKDGDTPTEYTKPITLDRTTTIKAIAKKDGMPNSKEATFTYKVYKTYSVYYSYGGEKYLNGKYKAGDPVTVTATDLPGKTFTKWKVTGMSLTKETTSKSVTFQMPAGEVVFTPEYQDDATVITNLTITVPALVPGQALPQQVTCLASTPDGSFSCNLPVTWTPNSEAVVSGTTYTASVTLAGGQMNGYRFAGMPRFLVQSETKNGSLTKIQGASGTLNSPQSLTITFPCTAAKPKLKEIIYPAELPGLPNGTTLSEIKKQVVEQIRLVTDDDDERTTTVTWSDPAEGTYDSDSSREQTFTLTGTVAIPEGIDRNNVEGTVTVRVTVSARGFVGAPIASVAAGRYSTAQSVTLSSLTDGAAIYYTTDGTEPTEESTLYTGPIQVSTDTTLKAIATKDGMSNSIVSTYVYTFRRSSGGQTNPGGQTKPGETTKPSYTNCSKGDTCPLAAFSDLVPTAWYHNGIHYCLDNGLMSGYGNGIFAPSDTFNRAMMVQVFYNMEKRPAQNSSRPIFDDVASGQWYSDAVGWASANGITTGYGKTFGPNDAVTREQVAQFLYNFARFKGYDTTARAALSAFTDGSSTSSWAQTAMQWAVGTGVLNGKGDGVLDPAATATRAEVATMLTNFCEKAAK